MSPRSLALHRQLCDIQVGPASVGKTLVVSKELHDIYSSAILANRLSWWKPEDYKRMPLLFQLLTAAPTICDGCKQARPIVTNLDGDDLCQSCANKWVRAEGDYQAYLEMESGDD